MLYVVLIKDNERRGKCARGIIARNLVTGKIERFRCHAVVNRYRGYGNTYFLSTNAMASNGSAAMVKVTQRCSILANPSSNMTHLAVPYTGDKQSKNCIHV